MKKVIKKFWGIALIVVMLSSLLVFATPTSAADPLKWNLEIGAPMGIPGLIYTQMNGTDILDFAVSADGMTFYVVLDNTNGVAAGTASTLLKGTMGGALWSDLTSATNNRLVNTNLYDAAGPNTCISFVAISPDNPDIAVVLGLSTGTGFWQAAASRDGGLNFYDMGTIQGTGARLATAYDLDVAPISSGNIYYVAIAGVSATPASAIYYYNFGAAVGAWHDAVADFGGASVVPTGTNPAGMWAAAGAAPTDFRAVEFSTNFGSDFSVLAISEDGTNNTMWLHTFSLASHKWDADLNLLAYPVAVETTVGAITVNAASIATGPDFMGIEEETLVAFVGASVLDVATETGGIYRIDESQTVTTIRTTGINSITFDGTTLVAGSYTDNNVWRVLDVTVNSPVARAARSMKRIGVDDTIANDMVIVHYAGANVFGAKRGLGGALSKSTDYGYTWNDFTLMDTTNTVIDDIYMLPDGSAWYMSANDLAIASVYRMAGGATQRVLCTDMTATPGAFMLRGIPGDANVIYAAAKVGSGSTDVYVSADGGVDRWSRKTTFPGVTISDMAVESATVVYIADGVLIYKSTNSGSLWGEGVDTKIGGGVFNMISLGDGQLVIGGNAGGVEFSTDGGATWTPTLGVMAEMVPMYVAATGLGPNDTIFAASSASRNVYKGPAAFFAEFKTMNVPAITGDPGVTDTGIAYVDGILYVIASFEDGDNDDTDGTWDATFLFHSLTPTLDVHPAALWGQVYPSSYANARTLAPYCMNAVPGSALKYVETASSIKLYGIDATNWFVLGVPLFPAPYVYYFEDIVSPPSAAPVLRTPADAALFEIVSSMLADSELVNFTWDRASSQITSYNLWVALDEDFTELWFVANVPSASPAPVVSAIYGRGTFDPGETYYWKVQAATPFNGSFSETRNFTIAPSAASVPVIASPPNGSLDVGTNPSFSWTPVTGTTMYEFQLDTGTTFTAPMVSEQTATTAIMPNVTLEEGRSYFWRVRALEPVPSEWSAIGTFVVAVPEPPPVTPTQTIAPTPTFTIEVPPAVTVTIPTQETTEVSPAYIWAIIIIGAVLVIAVIVLIVRTRRQV